MHAPHPYMNLFEGNYGSTVCFDFIHGSSSHNTLFRNYIDMDCRMPDGRVLPGKRQWDPHGQAELL